MLTADEALARRRAGNARFGGDRALAPVRLHAVRRAELMQGQAPFAIILWCSDSRVPTKLVFDQGFGDLFVIRVAGNIVAPPQVGSVDFDRADPTCRTGRRTAVSGR